MEQYKKRFIAEYLELQDKYLKLVAMIYTEHDLDCPRELLCEQLDAMKTYMRILERRAEIEEIDLSAYKES